MTDDFGGSGIQDGGEENGDDTSGSHFHFYGWLLVDWLLGRFIRYLSNVLWYWFDVLCNPGDLILYTSSSFLSAIVISETRNVSDSLGLASLVVLKIRACLSDNIT